ncbi:Trp biosynthesis-associated membrane protein [Cellulomonas endometrii]|uniref:Trp biosynthesis-associated membrane protein n=1 Tax=Cellulomonas endometrii TaxID=3036301 RepID=UPI0024AD42D9|nr:Trp biosynthesis-associated membrane protein [Cellulomonas endometrii]
MLTLLLLSGLVALTALPVWITATGASPVAEEVDVAVRGTTAAPGLVAAALVLLAAAAALGLVGRVGRWVVVVVVSAGGALVVASALAARSGATATAERAAAEATGVPSLTAGPEVAAWPLASAALGVLVLVAAVGLARASGRWTAPSDRHERAAGPVGSTVEGPAARPATAAGAPAGRPAHPDAPDPSDERGTWDALTRGDDPT